MDVGSINHDLQVARIALPLAALKLKEVFKKLREFPRRAYSIAACGIETTQIGNNAIWIFFRRAYSIAACGIET